MTYRKSLKLHVLWCIKEEKYVAVKQQHSAFCSFNFYWNDTLWLDYIKQEGFCEIRANLTEGMDATSYEYVDTYIRLLQLIPFKEHILVKKELGWTAKDFEYAGLAGHMASAQALTLQDAFLHANKYGLRDIPQEALQAIDGKIVIDGGAYTGDTLYLFHTLFPQSRIFCFEPQKAVFEKLKETITRKNMTERAVPICRGLSNSEEELVLYTGEAADPGATCNAMAKYDKVSTETIKTTSIDTVLKTIPKPVGLIKLDIEGLEEKALEGARDTIIKHKPVIVAAIYHRPEDFFTLKDQIKKLNPHYKFMIRRSEMIMPMADLVLIAYEE